MRILLGSVVFAFGCGAKLAPPEAEVPADAGHFDTAVFDVSGLGPSEDARPPTAEVAPIVDAAPVDARPPEPAPAIDCFGPDVGPSVPGTFLSMDHNLATDSCPSTDCRVSLHFEASCALSTFVKGVELAATASPADCDTLKRWATSKRLIDALDDKVTCFGKDGPIFESTEVYLSTGSPRKKTFDCPLEPFVSHRACIAKFRAKYFP